MFSNTRSLDEASLKQEIGFASDQVSDHKYIIGDNKALHRRRQVVHIGTVDNRNCRNHPHAAPSNLHNQAWGFVY
jgi:hypothetical protein